MVKLGKDEHVRGPEDARITLLEYGDFQCPHCGAAYQVVRLIEQELGGQLRFAFREFPLTQIHEYAQLAAEAAEAASAQGKFWQMHNYLFQNQEELSPKLIEQAARELGLDADPFIEDLNERVYKPRVQQDVNSGLAEGVHGTPTFFINGEKHEGGRDFDALMEAIASHRRRTAA